MEWVIIRLSHKEGFRNFNKLRLSGVARKGVNRKGRNRDVRSTEWGRCKGSQVQQRLCRAMLMMIRVIEQT